MSDDDDAAELFAQLEPKKRHECGPGTPCPYCAEQPPGAWREARLRFVAAMEAFLADDWEAFVALCDAVTPDDYHEVVEMIAQEYWELQMFFHPSRFASVNRAALTGTEATDA